MFKSINRLCIALALASTAACGNSAPEDVQSLALDGLADNGVQLNGFSLNGFSLNGFSLNGFSLNGFSLNGFSLNGFSLNGVALSSNSLSAQRSDNGSTISGKDFIGVRATVSIGNGNTAELRVDDAIYNPTAGIYVYNVSIQTDAGWTPICGTANGVPVSVVPSPGSWDMTTGAHNYSGNSFTLACVNAAIGKCVLWGYHPWETKTECSGSSCRSQSLTSWQDACTRMVRADYCGDGVPHTRNGTSINLWDTLGVQLEADSSWDLEAEWATDGAHCIRHTRWVRADLTSSLTDLTYVLQKCPGRLALSLQESCGDSSDFNTKKGLNVSPSKRKLLRNESALNQ